MHRDGMWPPLPQRDSDAFTGKIAKISFLILLNSLQAGLQLWTSSTESPSLRKSEGLLFDQTVNFMDNSICIDHWTNEYIWQPSDIHLAKLRYRQGHFLRRVGGPSLTIAYIFIEQELQLLSDNPMLLKERQLILE